MMKLRSAAPSPFGRKVKIVGRMLGLMKDIEIVATDTMDANDPLRRDNPLGKIPSLTLADGTVLYDSRVIAEYLDDLGGGDLFPKDPSRRWRALTLQSLADGLMDALLLKRYETVFRGPDRRSDEWLAHQTGKVERALAALEASPPAGPIDIGHVATACAYGYLDLRFDGEWRKTCPKGVAWLDAFARDVPAFEATRAVLPK